MAGPKNVLPVPPSAQQQHADPHEYLKRELHEAVKSALGSVFTKPTEVDPRTRFHEQFRKEADEYDRDFQRKYQDDLNTTLVFSGLFSAVASAFIIYIQSQVSPDHGLTDRVTIQVQAILCSSLASSLLVAFLAMLGKQWLNSYADGSFIERNRFRALKMSGMTAWRFELVMEALLLIIQGSLLQLGYALTRYFWNISRVVASVIMGYTVLGLAIYLFIVIAGTVSVACPFQTPASVFLRSVPERYGGSIRAVIDGIRHLLGYNQPSMGLFVHRHHVPLSFISSAIESQDDEVRGDSHCIFTMFKMTNTSDSIIAMMAYIPEITWDSRLKSVPLLQVYQALRDSLWYSVDRMVSPRPGADVRAFLSAKSLLHLYIQRHCLHERDESLESQVKVIRSQRGPFASSKLHGDHNLQSTFRLIDYVFGTWTAPIPWSQFELDEHHHHWLSHILQYRAWDTIRTRGRLTEDVRGFVDDTLSRRTLPDRIGSNCLFIISMVVGHEPKDVELLIKDRSYQKEKLINTIFLRLGALVVGGMTKDNIAIAIEALSLVIMVREEPVGEKCFALFKHIINLVKLDERLWGLATLSMKGAFSMMVRPPYVDDIKTVLEFLHYHVSSDRRAKFGDEPISNAFRAIVYSSDDCSRLEFAGTFTSPLFLDSICRSLSNKGNRDLQEIALLLLPRLDTHLFVSDTTFADPTKAQTFVLSWLAAVKNCPTSEEAWDKCTTDQINYAIAQVFFGIAHSRHLRTHLPKEAWDIADTFHYLLSTKPPPLQRCTQDKPLLAFVMQANPEAAMHCWMPMLWMEHGSLSSDVRDAMEKVTKETIYKELDTFYGYLEDWEKRLEDYDPSDQAVGNLRARQQSAITARKRLYEIYDDVRRNHPSARL